MPGVWAQLKQDMRNPVVVASVCVLTTFLVVSGPFGSYLTLNLVERMMFWVPVGLIGCVGGLTITYLVSRWCRKLNERDATLLSALLSAKVLALPLFLLVHRFAAPVWNDMTGLIEAALLVFFLNLAICSLRNASLAVPPWAALTGLAPDLPQPPPQRLPGFVSRLPADIQAPVSMITGRNHHIEVTTDLGTATLLLRFSDAILSMEPGEGMQVHRSHWVAFRRMHCMEKIGQRHFLVLDQGNRVPISKNHVETLRQILKLPQQDGTLVPMAEAAE